jgi:hypothetical protein
MLRLPARTVDGNHDDRVLLSERGHRLRDDAFEAATRQVKTAEEPTPGENHQALLPNVIDSPAGSGPSGSGKRVIPLPPNGFGAVTFTDVWLSLAYDNFGNASEPTAQAVVRIIGPKLRQAPRPRAGGCARRTWRARRTTAWPRRAG